VIRLEIERLSGIDVRDVSHDGVAGGVCPGCGAEPFRIATHPPVDGRAGGRCVACGDAVGWVYVEDETIFGRGEDDAVLVHGRARVYGMEAPRG
jgi:hypothetical protein